MESLAAQLAATSGSHDRLPLLLALAEGLLGVDARRALALAEEAQALAATLAVKRAQAEAHYLQGRCADILLDHETALARPDALGQRVVVLDVVGHIEAIGLGELLARAGVEATVVTPFALPICLDRETLGYALPRAAPVSAATAKAAAAARTIVPPGGRSA